MRSDVEARRHTVQLRASCRHCRRRKMKCSGTSPCSACQDRQIDCIFEKQSRMGRPPITGSTDPMMAKTLYKGKSKATLADTLSGIFEEIFLAQLPTSSFSIALKDHFQRDTPFLTYGDDEMKVQNDCTLAVYDVLFPLLVQELLERCKDRLGMPEQMSTPAAHEGPSYLAVALARDRSTLQVFQTPPSSSSSVVETAEKPSEEEFNELFRIWLASHPLSSTVSLNSSLVGGPINQALRALISSEALSLSDDVVDRKRCASLLDNSKTLFYSARLPEEEDWANLFLVSQVAALLCWNCFAHRRAKEGIVFLAFSCQALAQFHNVDLEAMFPGELCKAFQVLDSLLSLLTVWVFSQVNRPPVHLSAAGRQLNYMGMPHLFSRMAQMTSAVLSSRPSATGEFSRGDLGIIFSTFISDQQLSASRPTEEALLARAVQQVIYLCLTTPRNQISFPDPSYEALIRQCSEGLTLLGEMTQGNKPAQAEYAHMLSKVYFNRNKAKSDTTDSLRLAIHGTLVLILYETLVDAAIIVTNRLAASLTSRDLYARLCALLDQLTQCALPPTAQAQRVQVMRDRIHNCQEKLILLSLQSDSVGWIEDAESFGVASVPVTCFDEHISPTSSSVSESLLTPDESLYEMLWGQLEWDTKLDI